MNPVHLEFIVEVAKTGSISIASQNLNVTQSGISQAITNIESELGFKIFDRHRGQGPVPTHEGKQIIKLAFEVLSKLQELKDKSRRNTFLDKGKLKVASIGGFMELMLKPVSVFKEVFPNIELAISEEDTKDILDHIQQNTIDIGLISIESKLIKTIDNLAFDVLLEGKLKLFVSKLSPLAFYETITPAGLHNQKLVLYDSIILREFIGKYFNHYKDIHLLFTSNDSHFIAEAVNQNIAITFSPDFAFKNNPQVLNGNIVSIDLKDFGPVDVSLCWTKSHKKHTNSCEKEFMKLVKSEIDQIYK
ncbi:LysR family transcriptional regulator [Neobacillus drentensis]|uniref:LysR family transcriptional regulator n=1 Tax=Neobacillus drentensis TaxID=220684 RepID=UPI003000B215